MLVPIASPAVAHGMGLFETLLVQRGRIAFADEHFARMQRSAAVLDFPAPDAGAFHVELQRARNEAKDDEAALRCLYVAAGESMDDPWTLAAQCGPIPPLTRSRRAHGRVVTLDPTLTRALPEHKLTSYAACVIGLRRAAAAGADEGLFLTRDGAVLEGTATNVFAVASDGRLITAPVAAGILPGIVRAWVIGEAARRNIVVEERTPYVDELLRGAFLTGSLTGIAPIRTVDGRACDAPPAIVGELLSAL